ncbi:MAG TPA: hypothetical protein VH374_24745 [Polyangia bacterium]|jgi:hypothetical protein|nr:hypothetical protein [Polyangia bacterium]
MIFRRSGGWAAALFLCAALVAGCSSKTFTDRNFGNDAGAGFVPEVSDTVDGGDSATGGSSGVGGTGGDTATGGAGGAAAPDAGDDVADAATDALDNG